MHHPRTSPVRLRAAILALALLLPALAHADRVLIYSGSQTQRLNGAPGTVSHYFYVFDLDTQEYNQVSYFVAGGVKHISLDVATPIVYCPLKTSVNASQTYFVNSSSDDSIFRYVFQLFSGNNVLLDIGGGFTGEFPKTLSYNNHSIFGNGTTAEDAAYVTTGAFTLNLTLTRQANNALAGGGNITQAAAVIVGHLNSLGYH